MQKKIYTLICWFVKGEEERFLKIWKWGISPPKIQYVKSEQQQKSSSAITSLQRKLKFTFMFFFFEYVKADQKINQHTSLQRKSDVRLLF